MKTTKPSPDAARQPHTTGGEGGQTRRSFLDRLGLGTLLTAIAGQTWMMVRALVPNVLYEPSLRFKVGTPDRFPEGVTFLEDRRLFIFRNQKMFYAISGVCTHLGCTVKMIQLNQPQKVEIRGKLTEERWEFHCPCHGSKFYAEGTPYAGPAPTPLAWYRLEVAADDGQLIVNLMEPVNQDFRLTV